MGGGRGGGAPEGSKPEGALLLGGVVGDEAVDEHVDGKVAACHILA